MKNSLYYPHFSIPLAWHPLSNASLKDKPIQALQLKSGVNKMTCFSSKIQCSHLPGDTTHTNAAWGPGNVADALVIPLWPKKHSPHDYDALPVPTLCCSCDQELTLGLYLSQKAQGSRCCSCHTMPNHSFHWTHLS